MSSGTRAMGRSTTRTLPSTCGSVAGMHFDSPAWCRREFSCGGTRCKGVGIVLSGERQSNNIQLDWCKWTNCSEAFIEQRGLSRLVHGSIWAEDNSCDYLLDVEVARQWLLRHCWLEGAFTKGAVNARDSRADVLVTDSRE